MMNASNSMLPVRRPRAAFTKLLPPVLFFFAGVTYDTVTLTRIDQLFDNLMLLFDLSLLGLLIVLTGRAALLETGPPDRLPQPFALAWMQKARPWYPHAMQFLFGGLFSAYAIFYSQSASGTATAVFFAVLVGLLVANELWHDRLANLRLLVGLYAVVCFSFLTFFLPAVTGVMSTPMFLLGAGLSLLIVLRVVSLVYAGLPGRSRRDVVLAAAPAAAVLALLVGFYFLRWIPPVPLSLKAGGIYHKVERAGGAFQVSFEEGAWYQFWKRSDNPFHGAGPAHCFTAVFAPVALQTTVVHHWQYRQEGKPGAVFVTTDRIPLPIAGGREGGYRGVTAKGHLEPGDWRVDVETGEGRIIGRIAFRVEAPAGPSGPLKTLTY